MEKLIRKYANLLLKCLKVKDKKYLFIESPLYLKEFVAILKEEAKCYNLEEVYVYYVDSFKQHDLMKELSQDKINKQPCFNREIYNKYAKVDAAFLFLVSMVPNLMSDIDAKKIKDTNLHVRETQKYFRNLYETDKLNWCIAGVPNKFWAEELNMSLDELWKLILEVSLVDEKNDPYQDWLKKLDDLDKHAQKLNEYNFDYLHYKNKLGTDLLVYLPDNHVWCSGKDDKGVIVNLPTEEVFTSPQYNKTSGVVYSSKPLIYNNVTIEDIYLKFDKGKIVESSAKKGEDVLKGIISTDKYSCYLGECALVNYDSPISNTSIIFEETLYDENASCHLAIGRGFNECLKNAEDKSGDEIRNLGVNDSKVHVDFMIGTEDLSIIGVTKDKKEIEIFKDGNFVI